jgi:hypothetical protein
MVSKTITPAAEKVATDDKRGKGYQETAHVRSYYKTAKV